MAEVDKVFERNKAWLKAGDNVYNTPLTAPEEKNFRAWVMENSVPFDPGAKVSDYDMRGFWKALEAGDERAKAGINPNDKKIHYPDYWKTPYHESFSAESQWADPKKAPVWNEQDQLVLPNGNVVFDERANKIDKIMANHQKTLELLNSLMQGRQR